jgi:deazaflavin-dependent oxidoreductase (nitroreductase family)
MAREVARVSALQKLIQRIVMWQPVTSFFATRLHRIDNLTLKLTKGKFTASQLAGWTIIQLTTIGARSKQPRTTPLVGVMDGEKIALVGSSFGRKHNPAWYYNLKTYPECDVTFKARTAKYIARELDGEEYKRYWQLAISKYAGYEKYRQRAAHRHIPIMLLEPKK